MSNFHPFHYKGLLRMCRDPEMQQNRTGVTRMHERTSLCSITHNWERQLKWQKENIAIETRTCNLLWCCNSRQPLWIEKGKYKLRLWEAQKSSTFEICEHILAKRLQFHSDLLSEGIQSVSRKSLTFSVCILASLQLALFNLKWENKKSKLW